MAVGSCNDVAEGEGFEVIVDPDDPEQVLLVGSLYDPWTGLFLAGIGLVAGGWWTARTWHDHRRAAALAAGSWSAAVVERDSDAAVLRGPGDPPGSARSRTDDVGRRDRGRPPRSRSRWPATSVPAGSSWRGGRGSTPSRNAVAPPARGVVGGAA